ncbi:MAG TPA: isoprenylcysteine carboxylmethyltransferase family protein, partial [Candidatus Limnocylindrales bacterium]|nr:isoprenylcysteine carboxylmethyltransferase family protein [Candidatus Limnocylindrales bacterium]
LLQAVLIVVVVAAVWSLGPDWSGPLRLVGYVVGVALLGIGLILILRGVSDLGRARTPVPRPREGGELVETGIYAVVRHPIYAGLMFAAVGGAVINASLIALALTACLAVVLWLKSMVEEAWLVQRYPGYAAYRARTGRFMPRVRRSPT